MFENKKLIEIVRECVNAYDSEGLLEAGSPKDEYEPEILAIAQEILPSYTVTEVWIIICNTFAWYFHPHHEPVLYWKKHKNLAVAIVRRLPELAVAIEKKPQ